MKILAILTTLCFLTFASPMLFAQNNLIKLMTYNIYHGENPYKPGSTNIEEVTSLISEVNPDFLALQEVDSMTQRTAGFAGKKLDLAKTWAEKTSMNGHFAKAIDFSEGGYGEAVLTKSKAKFETISLPVPEGGEGRSMAVSYVELDGGNRLAFAGTHLCHESPINRAAQVKAILEYFKDLDHPVIITGDFNFESEEEGYALMAEHFQDAALVVDNPEKTYSSDDPKIRIDYFWVPKNFEIEVVSVQTIPVGYSDHLPLVMEIKMP
jgi:endonuclease/exonuclease/phosphatase family metal-dependent hydrolase